MRKTIDVSQWRIQEFLKVGAVKQKGGAVMIKIQYFGEKSLESSMKSVSKGGAAAPTSSAVDPPLMSVGTKATPYLINVYSNKK
jgi:hypothetical protein